MNARNDTTARGSVKGGYLHWQHLQAELLCLDLLIRREVRRWVLAGQDPNDDYRGLYVTQTEAEQLLDRPFGVSWGQMITLPPAEEDAFDQALAQARQQAAECAEQMASQGQTSRLLQLATAFDLDRTALDILLLCLAPALDTKYERLYGYLQDNVMRRRPTVRLVLDLLGEPGMAQVTQIVHLAHDAPLFRHRLLDYITEAPPNNMHWINQTLQIDEGVVAWLLGHYQPHPELQGHVALTTPASSDLDRLLAGNATGEQIEQTQDLLRACRTLSDAPLLAFWGMDQVAQQAAARCLVAEINQPLLVVQLDRVIGERCLPHQAVQLALRDARLTGAVVLLAGWDVCLDEDKRVAPEVLTALCNHPGLVIMTGQKQWQPGAISRQRTIFEQAFDLPGYAQRLALWRHFVDSSAARPDPGEKLARDVNMANEAFAALAGQFGLTSGQIRDAVAAACDLATQQQRLLQADDLFVMARAYSNPRLSMLAHKVTPRYAWDDIVLPVDERAKLSELVATVRQRYKVLETWGVGQKLATSSGVMVLFAGPPGTGKTMAAEVVASELKLDLYKIDLSSIVSKYIGETEKNLERIFTEASNSNSILFFDEADAIFGKRAEVKDAHDRYANIEVSYLLQRMEIYDGITILATNLRANLDDAFARRFYRTVEFPFPKREDRVRIWQTLFPPEVKQAPDLDFDLLARRFELAGGNIRNIIYSAAFMAANDEDEMVTMAHLLHGARREMQKMGRLVNQEDFAAVNLQSKQMNGKTNTKG